VEELTQVLRTRSGSSLPAQPTSDAGRDTFASLSASWSPLVAVQRPPAPRAPATKPPFFCVPGNLGNVFTDLGDLARFLGPDQPFFGFQDGPQNPSQIPALASLYVREMRRVQPTGPYFLGGVCLGAVVAYEMAQQLVKQGGEVSLLAMVEPARPWRPSPKATLSFLGYLYDRFVRRIGYAREVHRDGDHVHRDGDPGRQPQGLAEQSAFLRMKLKLVKNVWALRRYTPQPYPGPIHAFLSEGSLNIQGNPQLEWRHLARGEWSVHSIPGDHGSITGDNRITIEPAHMLVLAQKLRTAIDERIRPDVGKDPYDSYAPGSSRASSHENADPG